MERDFGLALTPSLCFTHLIYSSAVLNVELGLEIPSLNSLKS